jgi:hypothetical protein
MTKASEIQFIPSKPKRVTEVRNDMDRWLAIHQYFDKRTIKLTNCHFIVRNLHYRTQSKFLLACLNRHDFMSVEHYVDVDIVIVHLLPGCDHYEMIWDIRKRVQSILTNYFSYRPSDNYEVLIDNIQYGLGRIFEQKDCWNI